MYASLLQRLQWSSEPNRKGRDRRSQPPRGPAAPRRSFLPWLEALEDRTVPSTITVSNLLDSGPGSLRQAVLDANSLAGADRIRFAPAARDGTIVLTSGQLNITDDLTIDGPGQNRLTLSGNNASRVFHISGGTTDVEIKDLTIANGRATGTTVDTPFGPVTLGGGILNNGGGLTLSHVTLSNNQAVGATTGGGAIATLFGATLTVGHSTFTNNRSSGTFTAFGGGIYNDAGSTLTVEHSTFTGNQATASLSGAPPQGIGEAGALSNAGGSVATISHSRFEGNLARGGDGANGGPGQSGGLGGEGTGSAIDNVHASVLAPFASSTMTIEHCRFTGNLSIGGNGGHGGAGGAGGAGGTARGAIQNIGSILTVVHSTFTDNQAMGGNGGNGGTGRNGGAGGGSAGGAISNTDGALNPIRSTLQVSHVLFHANQAIGGRGGNGSTNGNGGAGGVGTGGGLRNFASDWDVSNSVFLRNQAVGGGGGDRGSGGLLGGTGGVGQGGGLLNVSGAIGTVSNTTLVNNSATGGAGGVGGNGGNGEGGGVFNGPPTADGVPSLTLLHSLVAFNRADGGAAGAGGSAGSGRGGGLYLSPGGMAFADLVTAIRANDASTSDDDVFGTLSLI